MDFALTDEQKAVAELATKVFERRLTAEVRKEIEKSGDRFDAALWGQLADAGLLGVALRDDIGGAGHGLLELCSLLQAAGAACAPVPLWAVSIASMAIDQFGTPDQRALLQAVIAGDAIIVPALAEPDGRDARVPRTRATRTSAGWRLDGVKTCVPSATRASRLVVSATTADGPALFLAAASPVAQQVSTTGEIVGLVSFDGAPAEPLGDTTAFEWMVERGNIGLCAMELGITEQVLRMTAAYTSQRVQFDRPVATFQAVAQRAADAWIDVESIRLTTWEAAWRLSAGLPAAREVAIAKFFAAEAGQRVTYACQHLHGGIGFDLDYPLAKYYPLSKQIELTLGGANAQLAWLGVLLAA
jgi:alkylation response protein AidB-like acyl-CoA dehydrogenase